MSPPNPPHDDDDLDDLDPGPVPAPDDEPTAAERAHARAFAELVDKVVAGRPPAAMSADDRALVEVATVIRAGAGLIDLPAARTKALIDQALRGAVERPGAAGESVPDEAPARDDLAARRERGPRAPWIVAGISTLVAAAAIVALVVRTPRTAPAPAPAPEAAALPEAHRSRPADALVGVIPKERAGDASSRIDAIFADRLDGYRELAFAPPSRRGGQ